MPDIPPEVLPYERRCQRPEPTIASTIRTYLLVFFLITFLSVFGPIVIGMLLQMAFTAFKILYR
jgi:hypothetical protein